jgi:hypothetical protein
LEPEQLEPLPFDDVHDAPSLEAQVWASELEDGNAATARAKIAAAK